MLFRKQMEPRCEYCANGEEIEEGRILCIKRGVSTPGDHCRSFVYDPFCRQPKFAAKPDFSALKEEDFSLEVPDEPSSGQD